MAKLSLPSFVGPPGATQLNTWKSLIEAFAEDTVSLTGVLPNSMTVDLDMDSNDILNVGLLSVDDLNVQGLTASGILTQASAEANAAAISAQEAEQSALDAAANVEARQVDSVSELRTSTFPLNIQRLWLMGYYGVGTAGGGPLYRDSADTTTADNGGTVFVDSDGVRWKRANAATNPMEWGATGDGEADDFESLTRANQYAPYIKITNAHFIGSNVTLTKNLYIFPGGKLRPDSLTTTTIQGAIHAGHYAFLDDSLGAFSLTKTDGEFNIVWFDRATLEARFEALSSAFAGNRPFKCLIPKPLPTDAGAIEAAPGRWKWNLMSPIYFTENHRYGHFFFYGHVVAGAAMDQMIQVGTNTNGPTSFDGGKASDVYFPVGLHLDAANNAATCFRVVAGDRVHINGILQGFNCSTICLLEGTFNGTGGYIQTVTGSAFTSAVLSLNTTGAFTNSWIIEEVRGQAASSVNARLILMRGNNRFCDIRSSIYVVGTGDNLENVVVVQATEDERGSMVVNQIGSIRVFGASTTILRIEDASGGAAAKPENLTIGFIYGSASTNAAIIDYGTNINIERVVKGSGAITLGADSDQCRVVASAQINYEDNGENNIINGMGKQSAANGSPLIGGSYQRGDMIDFTDTRSSPTGTGIWVIDPTFTARRLSSN